MHPFSCVPTACPVQSCGKAGNYPGCQWARGSVRPDQRHRWDSHLQPTHCHQLTWQACLDFRRKLDYLEKTHTATRRTSKLQVTIENFFICIYHSEAFWRITYCTHLQPDWNVSSLVCFWKPDFNLFMSSMQPNIISDEPLPLFCDTALAYNATFRLQPAFS